MSYTTRERKTTNGSADTLQTVGKGRCLIKRFLDTLRSELFKYLFTKTTSSTQETRVRDKSFGFTTAVPTIVRTVAKNNERRTGIESLKICHAKKTGSKIKVTHLCHSKILSRETPSMLNPVVPATVLGQSRWKRF